MNEKETGQMLGIVKALWPHSNMGAPEYSRSAWHAMLGAVPVDQVSGAIKELSASGHGQPRAPGAGVVLQAVTERATDLPEWDEAYREILATVSRFGSWTTPTAEHWSSPLIASFMASKGVWLEWCQSPAPPNNGTFAAQQRDAYKAMRARIQRDKALTTIGAPRRSSLKRLSPLEAMGLTPPAAPPALELVKGDPE